MDLHTPRWHVLTVKKGCEKKVSRSLQALGFEVLLPIRKVYRMWSDRRKRIDDPLFKGYAFVYVSEARRSEVFRAEKHMAFLRYQGKACVLRESEAELLRQWSEGIDAGETDTYAQLRPGAAVEILEGPFSGYQGLVRAIDSDTRLRLELLFTGSLTLVTVQQQRVKVL
ncbi:MAG: transcription termination/antitermination NusG family protein [Bacteroidia bacterium]|nr:transcription termination/antitermination NusG family protein [Bacteroidia bacterium]